MTDNKDDEKGVDPPAYKSVRDASVAILSWHEFWLNNNHNLPPTLIGKGKTETIW